MTSPYADFNAGTRRAIDTYRRESHCPQCGALTAPNLHRLSERCETCKEKKK